MTNDKHQTTSGSKFGKLRGGHTEEIIILTIHQPELTTTIFVVLLVFLLFHIYILLQFIYINSLSN